MGVQTAKFIVEGEVWGQDYKMQTIVYLKNQNIEAWMVKPLSPGCVNTVGILITKLTHPRTRNTGIRNRKL